MTVDKYFVLWTDHKRQTGKATRNLKKKKKQTTILLETIQMKVTYWQTHNFLLKTPYSNKDNKKNKIQYRRGYPEWKQMHCKIRMGKRLFLILNYQLVRSI